MKRGLVLGLLLLAACERSSPTGAAQTKPAEAAATGAGSAGDATEVSAAVRTAMNDLGAYTERVFKIMRQAKNCDDAAQQLEALVPDFQTIGPAMMKVKDRLAALPKTDRDRIKQESDELMKAMMSRFADADAIEQKGKDCEKSSAAFAAVAPKVMFVKKH